MDTSIESSPTAATGPVTAPSAEKTPCVPLTLRQCRELRQLLLRNAGMTEADSRQPVNVLNEEYSPRVVHLLDRIEATLRLAEPTSDGKFIFNDAISDVTSDSSDDDATLRLKPQYQNETEIAISRIFDIGKGASVVHAHIAPDAPHDGPSVVSMTGFGCLGRFGNQVLQYAFLKSFAEQSSVDEIQTPSWVGHELFGLSDRLVQRPFPPVVEFEGTKANSTFTDEFIDYVKKSSPGVVPELTLNALESPSDLKNVDVWGWFQWHTKHYAPFKAVLQDTFTAVPALQSLRNAFERGLRFRGGVQRTVVGLHLRLGDYQNIAASSFGYVAPTAWYRQWLAEIWPTLDNPVLFVASDDLEAVRKDFADYDVATADSIGACMPGAYAEMKAGFFPDWLCLTMCDVLAISNSTFSFSACMMNRREDARFYRAHWTGVLNPFDPWCAEPILHREDAGTLGNAMGALKLVYRTQGSSALAKNLFFEFPYYAIRAAIMKVVLWRKAASSNM